MNETTETKLHFLDYWRIIKMRWVLILIVFILVVLAAAVTVYFLPRQYFADVQMQVKPDSAVFQVFGSNKGGGSDRIDPQFVESQFQILRTKDILYPVIENLNLADKWTYDGQKLPEEILYHKLLKKLDLKQIRNTNLIDIGVYAYTPKLSSDIANNIALVYQAARRDEVKKFAGQGVEQVKEEVDKQEKKVNEAYATMVEIMKKDGITDVGLTDTSSVQSSDIQPIQQIQQKENDASALVNQLSAELEQIKTMKPDALMSVLHSFNLDNPTVTQVLPLYQSAVAQKALLLNSGLGENHPRVKAIEAQMAVYSRQLKDAAVAIRGTLQTNLQVAQQSLKDLQTQLAASKTKLGATKINSADYVAAKQAYNGAQKLLESARESYQAQSMQKTIQFDPAHIWQNAEPLAIPAKPNVPIYMSVAVLLGLIVGLGLAFFIEYLDTSVKSIEDVEKYLGVPVLAVVPKNVDILLRHTGESPFAEAYRTLRTNIEFNRKNADANTITFISGGAGEGKSTTLNNLAYTCALGGYKTLIVDADLRRPSQHKIFEVDNSFGLTDFLLGNASFDEVIIPTTLDTLSFVASGKLPSDAVGILNSLRMSDLITAAKHQYDMVFFDSPPILGVSDASIISSEVDITIMVIQHRRFPHAMLNHVKQAVQNVGGNLLGVVLNNVDPRHDQAYQYYASYYDYHESSSEPSKTKKPKQKAGKGNEQSSKPDSEEY